jgi:uncharacterized protein (TIGR02594 family)
MLASQRRLLVACSVAFFISTTPVLASAVGSDNPLEGPQVYTTKSGKLIVRGPYQPAPSALTARAELPVKKVRGHSHQLHSYSGGSWSPLVAEARRYLGTKPTKRRTLWCGAFMNMILKETGHRGSGSDMARSFARYGRRVSGPQVGAIAVMSRGSNGGHVGVVSGIAPSGDPIVISGNYNDRVAEAVYPRGRIIAYVVPTS